MKIYRSITLGLASLCLCMSANLASAALKGDCNSILGKTLGIATQLQKSGADELLCLDLVVSSLAPFSTLGCVPLFNEGQLFLKPVEAIEDYGPVGTKICDAADICGIPPAFLPPGLCPP